MDKQRDIYRDLIVKLFKENFESALFEEKRDRMISERDFESIRDEIEDEYYNKNRGITPYINAIKYLKTKIEASTAAKSLFSAVEDFIVAKENITITKIIEAPVNVEPEEVKTKKMKRKKNLSSDEMNDTLQVHTDCKSPHSCKKCRIMSRLDRSKPKAKQPKKNPSKQKTKDAATKREIVKTEPSNLDRSNIPSKTDDSETPIFLSGQSIETKSAITTNQNDEKPGLRLPYHDHEYSRISFYGSGMDKPNPQLDETNHKERKGNDAIKPVVQHAGKNNLKALKTKRQPAPNLLSTTVQQRPKQSDTLRQTTPAYYIQNLIRTTSTVNVREPTVVRPIPRLNQRILMTSSAPVNFNAPITIWQRPVIQQPVYSYYIQFNEPQ